MDVPWPQRKANRVWAQFEVASQILQIPRGASLFWAMLALRITEYFKFGRSLYASSPTLCLHWGQLEIWLGCSGLKEIPWLLWSLCLTSLMVKKLSHSNQNFLCPNLGFNLLINSILPIQARKKNLPPLWWLTEVFRYEILYTHI